MPAPAATTTGAKGIQDTEIAVNAMPPHAPVISPFFAPLPILYNNDFSCL
jgi:hypothetical protein